MSMERKHAAVCKTPIVLLGASLVFGLPGCDPRGGEAEGTAAAADDGDPCSAASKDECAMQAGCAVLLASELREVNGELCADSEEIEVCAQMGPACDGGRATYRNEASGVCWYFGSDCLEGVPGWVHDEQCPASNVEYPPCP